MDLESIAVRDIFPQAADGIDGRGIVIQADVSFMTASAATVRGSLVERSHEAGVLVWGSDATLEAIAVRGASAQANDGLFGDGVVVIGALPLPARATVSSSHIADSARAGVSNFGAFFSLATTRIECAPFDIEGEPVGTLDFVFDDQGGNACGCPVADRACAAVSSGLEPPESGVSGGE